MIPLKLAILTEFCQRLIMKRVYPGITTLTKNNWQQQIKDLNKRKITTAAVFLTGLNPVERLAFYQIFKKSTITYVPHVHIRHDFTSEEIDFFFRHYKARQFNTHANFLSNFGRQPYLKRYFLLETTTYFNLKDLKRVGGHYCLDLTHYFSNRDILTKWQIAPMVDKLIKSGNLPKANHLSGLTAKTQDVHFIKRPEYFDYLKKTPKGYLAKIICLETENSIREQLGFIKYIEKII